MRWLSPPPDGDQLRLDLFKGEPWDGRNPRGLTRAFNPLFLGPEPDLHEVNMRDPEQLDLFWREVATQREKPPEFVYRGAPLLL